VVVAAAVVAAAVVAAAAASKPPHRNGCFACPRKNSSGVKKSVVQIAYQS
jgi:hypothetical protein